MIKPSKLREMSVDELRNEAQDLSKQLFQLRLQKATGQLDKVKKLAETRKDLARVKTILTQKEQSR